MNKHKYEPCKNDLRYLRCKNCNCFKFNINYNCIDNDVKNFYMQNAMFWDSEGKFDLKNEPNCNEEILKQIL